MVESPCGNIYYNQFPGDLQPLADSIYVIRKKPSIRRGLGNYTYLYVVTVRGELVLGDLVLANVSGITLHHPDLINGEPAAYAGEMRFRNSRVVFWNNKSGHYLPNPGRDVNESRCIQSVIEHVGWGPLPDQSWA